MRSSARSALPVLFAILCFAAPALTQSPTKQPAKIPRGTVSGRVTIKDKPAAGVVVGLRKGDLGMPFEPYSRATTDQDGVYRITNLLPGNYQVAPAAPGFVVTESGSEFGKNVVVGDDETVDGVNFSLVRGGVITGKITDADERPLIQQQVNIYRAQDFVQPPSAPQVRSAFSITNAQTDDRGIYRIFGLAPGTYKVAAGRADDGSSGFSLGGAVYRQAFYPNGDASQAKVIEVSEGSEAKDIDIALGRQEQTFSVSGRVVDENSSPVPNIRFGFQRTINQRIEFANNVAISNARGEFISEGLIPGKYSVYMFPDAATELRAETLTFDVIDSDVTGVTIRLSKGATLAGVVILESDNKTAQAKLLEMQLRAFCMVKPGVVQSAQAKISPDGSFRLAGLPQGTINLSLGGMMGALSAKGFVISRIERDGIAMQRVEIKEGEQVAGVKVFVGYGNASLRGVVNIENGPLPEGAYVFIRLNKPGENNSNLRPAELDARKHFMMEGIPSGPYEVTANVVGGPIKVPKQVKQNVNLTDGVVTEVELTIDVATLPKP